MKRTPLSTVLSLSLLACSAADGGAPSPSTDSLTPGAHSLTGGHELLGIHNADMSTSGMKDMLDLFAGAPKGWAVESTYANTYAWLGGYSPPKSKAECLSKGGDGSVDKRICERFLGFTPVVRIDYASEGAIWADGSHAPSANIPPPGDLPIKGGIKSCPRPKGSNAQPIQKQTHLDCYLLYAKTFAERAGQAVKHWIIGNEINLHVEAEAFPNKYISGQHYAKVYLAARNAIRSVPGHADDIVMVAAPAFVTDDKPNISRGTTETWDDVLSALAPNEHQVDGLALHSYGNWTHVGKDAPAPAIEIFEDGHPNLGPGYKQQILQIEAWGFGGKFLLLSEFNVGMHMRNDWNQIDPYDRKEVSQFIRDAYIGIKHHNQHSGHTPLAGAVWYSWQNDCDLNAKHTDSLKCMKQIVGSTSPQENPYFAFRELAQHGIPDPPPQTCQKPWADASPLTFAEVPYTLSSEFKQFFQQAGGLAVLGFPIEEPKCRSIEVGGKPKSIWSQYTQRARLEYHPDNPAQFRVLLGHLGRALAPPPSFVANTGAKAGCEFIGPSAAQGNYVCGKILSHWRQYGVKNPPSHGDSLMLWGYPLGPAKSYTAKDGTPITAQWFERTRLELHGGGSWVLGGLLGCEESKIKGPGCQ